MLAERFAEEMVPDEVRAAERLRFMLRQEKPVVLPEERIVLLRTVPVLPELFTQEEWEQLRNRYYIHERGSVCNVTPDYSKLLRTGLRKTEQSLRRRVRQTDLSSEQRQFAEAAADVVSELRAFALRYRDCAEACQNRTAADSMDFLADGTLEDALRRKTPLMAYSPACGGLLYRRDLSRDDFATVEVLKEIQHEIGAETLDEVLFAWLYRLPVKVVPVTGSGKKERVLRAVKALDERMSREQWYDILRIARPPVVSKKYHDI